MKSLTRNKQIKAWTMKMNNGLTISLFKISENKLVKSDSTIIDCIVPRINGPGDNNEISS